MSYEVLDRLLSLVLLLTLVYYMVENGTEKTFKYQTKKDKKYKIPRNILITVTATIFIFALFVDAIKGVTLTETYGMVIGVALITYLSIIMFGKGANFVLKDVEGKAEEIVGRYLKEGDDK